MSQEDITLYWSAGPDSTACLIDLIEQQYNPNVLLSVPSQITYQEHSTNRVDLYMISTLLSAVRVGRYLSIPFTVIHGGSPALPPAECDSWETQVRARAEATLPVVKGKVIAQARCLDDDHSWAEEDTWQESLVIVNEYFPAEEWPTRTKREIYDRLGYDLWRLTWSCASPKDILVPCGTCIKCESRRRVEEEVGVTD